MPKKVSEEHANLFSELFGAKNVSEQKVNEEKALIDYKKSMNPYALKIVDKFFDILVNIGVNIIPALIIGIVIYKNYDTWFNSVYALSLTKSILMAVWTAGAPAVLASGILYIAIEFMRILVEFVLTLWISWHMKRIISRNKKLDAMIKDRLKNMDNEEINSKENPKTENAVESSKEYIDKVIAPKLYEEFCTSTIKLNINNFNVEKEVSFEAWKKYFDYCRTLPGGNNVNVFRTKNNVRAYFDWSHDKASVQSPDK